MNASYVSCLLYVYHDYSSINYFTMATFTTSLLVKSASLRVIFNDSHRSKSPFLFKSPVPCFSSNYIPKVLEIWFSYHILTILVYHRDNLPNQWCAIDSLDKPFRQLPPLQTSIVIFYYQFRGKCESSEAINI